jgi:hypothetical protein
MRTPERTDRIYQLTLTELAFIVIFLILLLTGWMIVKTEDEKAAALEQRDAALARAAELSGGGEGLARLENLHESLRQTEAEIRRILAGQRHGDPDELVSELVAKTEAESQNRQLRQRIEDLDAQLSTLREIGAMVEEAANSSGGGEGKGQADASAGREAARAEILSALIFKRALEQASGETVGRRREPEHAADYAKALREWRARPADSGNVRRLDRENEDLRGQLAWMQNRLDARGGRDYPPCWAEPGTGKPQYLLAIEIRDGGLKIEPAWPPERNGDAGRLPGADSLVGSETLSLSAFRARARPLDADSRQKNCRHYVRLINRVKSLDVFNRHRYAVEEFFYKFEAR